MPASRPRTRRPAGEVRRLLLDAAKRLFADHGYAGTTTRAIAREAGVVDSQLHRYFSSKAQLFEEALFEPFAADIENMLVELESRPRQGRSLEEECRFFVTGLYNVFSENRKLVLALISAAVYESEFRYANLEHHETPVGHLLDRLEKLTDEEIRARGLVPLGDPAATVRVTLGMTVTGSILGHWVMPSPPNTISHERMIDEIVTYMLHGLQHRPSDRAG